MSDQRSAKQSLLWFVELWRNGYDGKSIPGEREAFEEIKRRLSDETAAPTAKPQRYFLTEYSYDYPSSIQKMEPHDLGDWVRFDDIKHLLPADETDAEHRARCDLIDAMSIIDAVLTLGALTDSERLVWGEWLTRTRAKYPQQKARAPETPACSHT
jgi:hypothetical protein